MLRWIGDSKNVDHREAPEDWPGLYSSTSGILFLGTPHHGTGTLTSKGMMDAIIEQYAGCQIEDGVLRSLQPKKEMLNEVRSDFVELCVRTREQKRTSGGEIIGVDSGRVWLTCLWLLMALKI